MTRAGIREKLKFILDRMPDNPKKGDCYAMSRYSIESQIKDLKEGKNKIFYFMIRNLDSKNVVVDIDLKSETVYLSPPKYV